ncbi:MAG TPA: glycosyltransferase [Vicinamibacterales bacterium]|jgi:GT2 family glycosyltransferase|nr:glycosyltransferase [Vicinamibacterales bacterium]
MSSPPQERGPRLSIVVASVTAPPSLADCVRSFTAQAPPGLVEVVVATSADDRAVAALEVSCPGVRVVRAAGRASIPGLRAAGFAEARGDILAMTEDHCVAADDWVRTVIRAHDNGHVVVGGAIENGATDRTIDWAVFFCEYGRHMPPIAAGPVPPTDLAGPNVSYRRAVVSHFEDLLAAGTWDPLWHWRLAERGVPLVADPALVVYHCKHFTFGGFMQERYHYSRSFAGRRVAGAPLSKRLLFMLGTPLLPPLVLTRIVRRAWAKGRHRWTLLRALPAIGLFSLSWAAGEFVGYGFGEGQSALAIE